MLLVALAMVMTASRVEANLLLNGAFATWTDDSTPANWSVESRTYARISEDSVDFQSPPASLRIVRDQNGIGNNKGVLQNVPVTAGTNYTLSAWFLTPDMPDTTQYASARVVITWRNPSDAAIGSTDLSYIHSDTWTEQICDAPAPNDPAGDSVAATADVIVRCYGRSGGTAGGIACADDISFDLTAVEEGKTARTLATWFDITPNPFSGSTLLSCSSPGSGATRLAIYDATGQVVREFSAAGNPLLRVRWDGRDEAGDELPDGVYFAALEQNHEPRAVRKVMILR